MPQVLDGTELRRVGRQRKQRDVGGNRQCPGGMESGLIPDHHRVHARSEFLRKLAEELIDDDSIEIRRHQADNLSGGRTHRAQDIEIVVLRLSHRPWPRASLSPYTGQRALLAEARFVLEPNFHALVGMIRTDRFDMCHDVL